ncbi:MAG: hypothetical protein IT370_24305 [Deltaproteobacteria bacterium]|nr:hypothetical protein [Deltaproteobacteria bacterium]
MRPLLPLARRLVERGQAVIWAISGDGNEPAAAWGKQLAGLGVHFIDLDQSAAFPRGDSAEMGGMSLFRRIAARANDVASGAASAIEAALAGRRAHAGVYDFFALWGYVAMRRLAIADLYTVVSAFPAMVDRMPASSFMDDPLYHRELDQLRQAGHGCFAEVPRAGVIPRDPALRSLCFSSARLCPDPPAGIELLGVAREALPHIDDTVAAPEADQALVRQLEAARAGGARVVLLSMGTMVTRMFTRMGAAHVASLRRLYSTLAAAALRAGAVVVASTTELSPADLGVDEATLGSASTGRVFAMPFVPQPLLFCHGLVDVMLTHGGANTFHEAAASGIPLLISPGFGDQESVALAAARLGVGVCVEAIGYPTLEGAFPLDRVAGEVLPAMLAAGVSRWKQRATEVAALLAREDGIAAAEALVSPRRSSSPRNA